LGNTYTYNSFGNVTASTGSIVNRFQYTGREFDPEDSLYFYRARYYDQTTGRFISEDPIQFRAGINFYLYVWNRATGLVDPTGKSAGGVGGTLAGVAGTLAIAGAGEGSCSVVADSEGNFGLLCCLGFGGGVAAGADLGLAVNGLFCPGCKTICDLEGGFVAVQGFGAVAGGLTGGGSASIGLNQVTFSGNVGPAGGVGGGGVVLGGSCKLALGGKKCHDCPNKH
jgi:RHS repeat-associated protein